MEAPDARFLAILLAFALAARLLLAAFYISVPDLPHDMQYYIEHARFFAEGKPYDRTQSNGLGVVYGPLSLASYWAWISVFGADYFTLKLMPILFDIVSIALVYFIARRASNPQVAKYAAVFYAFSYLALLSAGAQGNDDHIFMFFLLAAIFAAMAGSAIPSALLTGIAAGFKPIPIVVAPLVAYYLYRKEGARSALAYSAVSALVFFALLAPFYLESGASALLPYTGAVNFEYFSAGGIAPLNIARLAAASAQNAAYFLQNGAPMPFSENPLKATNRGWMNDAAALLSKPLFYLSFLLFAAYAYVFRQKSPETELLRNIVFLIFFALLFSKVLTELLFLYALPALAILVPALEKSRFSSFHPNLREAAGALLLFSSVLIFSLFYRESAPDFAAGALLLLFAAFAAGGTYMFFSRSSFAWPLAIFTLGCALFSIHAASPLHLLAPLIPFPDAQFGLESVHAYLIKTANLLISGLLAAFGALLIMSRIHGLLHPGGHP